MGNILNSNNVNMNSDEINNEKTSLITKTKLFIPRKNRNKKTWGKYVFLENLRV